MNWGLGHATRLSVLIDRHIAKGDEVVIAGDGMSLAWLRSRYPNLRSIELPHLDLHYSPAGSQIKGLLKQAPHFLNWLHADHRTLQNILAREHFDLVISDNRFGFCSRSAKCVYVTHQLNVMTGGGRLLSSLATAAHRWFIRHYDECWVPDYEQWPGLAGDLSHIDGGVGKWNDKVERTKIKYIGPLSRFGDGIKSKEQRAKNKEQIAKSQEPRYDNVALLSGLEPQRTMLENELKRRWRGTNYMIIRGVIGSANAANDGHLLDTADDETFVGLLKNAKHIVCRSGYSTIMDLAALGLLPRHYGKKNASRLGDGTQDEDCGANDIDRVVELIPTPGQPEQEYLAKLFMN